MGAAALAETQRSGSLVDVPGGYMIVHDFAGKGVVCGQTWAAMCLVVDHEGSVSMRGFKGSVFNKLSSAVRSELVVSGGQPGSQWRPSEVRSAAIAAYATSPPVVPLQLELLFCCVPSGNRENRISSQRNGLSYVW